MTPASDVLAWLAARPRLLDQQPVDLSICSSCRRSTAVLAVLSSPGGAYALCPGCLGADGVPKPPPPAIRPARAPRAH